MKEIEEPLDSYKEYPGPILLLAGPGTGKTFQLAMRIKFLLENLNASPEEITVITFTNEAARNMRERLSQDDIAVPKERHPEIISTMHSLGNSIIGTNPQKFGLGEEYNVLHDKDPRIVLLQDAANLAGFERSNWKQTDECRRNGNCQKDIKNSKCMVCVEYEKILRKCSLVDYDDQIFLACKALRDDIILIEKWKQKTKYLLVDEYQDINQAQCELIQLLTQDQESGLFAVGDDDQSIYSFRGGNPNYIRNFENFFGTDSKIGRLSKSWRCPEHILKGARAMVTTFYTESVSKPEPTFSEKIKENNKIVFYDVPSYKKEAQIIASISKEKIKANSVTIIIPNGNYLQPIKESLLSNGLDYKYKISLNDDGLIRFTVLGDWVENPKNNLVMRYLIDLIINNHDELTHKIDSENNRITLKRESASKLIANLWIDVNHKQSLFEIILAKSNESTDGSYLKELNLNLNDLLDLLKNKGNSRKGLSTFLMKSGLFVAPCKNPNGIIAEVREWKNEIIGSNRGKSFDPINIYNMPSSKGLEGDVIFVIGISDSLFPKPGEDISEQSRLFYVAMTRAKKELYLLSSRTRPAKVTYEKISYQLKRSEFIDAIPDEHIYKKYIESSK